MCTQDRPAAVILFYFFHSSIVALPGDSDGKEFSCSTEDLGLVPWVGKIPWRRERQPTPVFLPGESHGQRSLTGYNPRGHKELDTAEQLTLT